MHVRVVQIGSQLISRRKGERQRYDKNEVSHARGRAPGQETQSAAAVAAEAAAASSVVMAVDPVAAPVPRCRSSSNRASWIVHARLPAGAGARMHGDVIACGER